MHYNQIFLKTPLSYRNQIARYFKAKGLPVQYTHDGFLINHIKVKISFEFEYVSFIMLSPAKVIVSVPFATPEGIYSKYLRYFKNAHQCNLPNLSFSEILKSVQQRQMPDTLN